MTPTMAAAGLGSVDADTRGVYTTDDVQQRSMESLTLLIQAGGDINGKDKPGIDAAPRGPHDGDGTTLWSSSSRRAPT
jgi:hypothetical protein